MESISGSDQIRFPVAAPATSSGIFSEEGLGNEQPEVGFGGG